MTPAARSPAMGSEVDAATLFERHKALRALLRRPLLVAGSPAFPLVRKHAPWLREWLARHPEWRLEVDTEHARLRKLPADLGDTTRPARDPGDGTPFTRRRYVVLCLALAALEGAERQITLGTLADDILRLSRADDALTEAGVTFELETRSERRDLVQVVRFLLDLGLMVRIHGDEQRFIDHYKGRREQADRRNDALYTLQRPVLASLLGARRAPSTLKAETLDERLAGLLSEPVPETAEGRNRRIRSKLTRALLDDPVLYHDTLDTDEQAYLRSQWSTLCERVEEATGLVREVRGEGLAMVDERGDATDLGMPEEGTDGHLALLLAEHLAEHARQHPGERLGRAALEQYVAALVREHAHHWAKRVKEPGAEIPLLAQTLERLEALALVRCFDDGGVEPRPAIGRFALRAPNEPGAPRQGELP